MFDWTAPSSFASDPWGYAGNQSGHAMIGVGAGVVTVTFDTTDAMTTTAQWGERFTAEDFAATNPTIW